jgi:hypothetical protein
MERRGLRTLAVPSNRPERSVPFLIGLPELGGEPVGSKNDGTAAVRDHHPSRKWGNGRCGPDVDLEGPIAL